MKPIVNVDLNKVETVLVDADSICYKAACTETLEECYASIEHTLETIMEANGVTELEIWVESPRDKLIFRKHVATTKPYKGHRKPNNEQVKWLDEAKDYIVKFWEANVTYNYEAEDMVLIRANQIGLDKVVVAAIDKDVYQEATLYYNYNKKEHFSLTEQEAAIRLYRQILTGDSTDNIPGIYRFGTKKAEEAIPDETLIERLPFIVAKEYALRGYSYDYLIEQSRLIYILRHMTEVFMFPLDRGEYDEMRSRIEAEKKQKETND